MGEWRTAEAGLERPPRIRATVPVRISTVDAEVDPTTGRLFFRSAEETTANLSRGGAYVESWEPLEAGRRIVVDIELPHDRKLQLVGQVAWTQRRIRAHGAGAWQAPGYGIQFTGASAAELARLDRYLDGLEPGGRVIRSPDDRPRPPSSSHA